MKIPFNLFLIPLVALLLTVLGCSKPPTCETSGQYIIGFLNGVQSSFKNNLINKDKRELVVKVLGIESSNQESGKLICNVKLSWNVKRDDEEVHLKDYDILMEISKDPRDGDYIALPVSLTQTTKESAEKNLLFIELVNSGLSVEF